MNAEEEKLYDERYEINTLLSQPELNSVVWKARVIVILSRLVDLLGLELVEKDDEKA